MSDFVRVPESDWQAIVDATRAKTGGTEKLLSGDVATEIAGIQVGGGPGGENALDYANRITGLFYGSQVPSGTEINISFGSKAGITMNSAALQYFMRELRGAKSVKVTCGGEAPATMDMNSFARCDRGEYDLERIDLSGAEHLLKPSNLTRALEYRMELKEVLGEFDMSNCTTLNNIAARCEALETIRIKSGTIKSSMSLSSSPNLTAETIQSVIDGLADLTGSTAQTLTLHATVGAKLTDAQKASATAKNWTISY